MTEHLLWVGSGEAKYSFLDFDYFDKVTFVEANKDTATSLSEKFQSQIKYSVKNFVVSIHGGIHTFYETEPTYLARLDSISELKSIYPNLNVARETQVNTLSVKETFEECVDERDRVTLLYDLPDVRGSLLDELSEVITKYDLNTLYINYSGNFCISNYYFRFLNTIITASGEKYAALLNDSSSIKNDYTVDSLRKELEKYDNLNDHVSKLFSKNLHDIDRKLSNLPFELKKASSNTAKQIESFISLNNYLSNGDKPLSFHGWPISPDIGLILMSYIEKHNISSVIEFGSGTSTVLLAKALNKMANVAVNGRKPLLSFEHNEKYLELTSNLVKDNRLEGLVDLSYAPLINISSPGNEEILYYSCENALDKFSKDIPNNDSPILVLVDGPPGTTGKNARCPALSFLLKYLSNHRMFIVMDDYDRPDEIETFKIWIKMVEERGIQFKTHFHETEKGLSILELN